MMRNALLALGLLVMQAGCNRFAKPAPTPAPSPSSPTTGYQFREPSEEWEKVLQSQDSFLWSGVDLSHAEVATVDPSTATHDWVTDAGGPATTVEERTTLTAVPIEAFFFGNPETVCAPDDRSKVIDTRLPPWNGNCRLIITLANGRKAVGTGWLMGPRLVVTAGHCVHRGRGGGYFPQVEVVPGADGVTQPFGSQVSKKLVASKAWREQGDIEEDFGAIILDKPFDFALDQHRVVVEADDVLKAGDISVAGYPADKGDAGQWTHAEPLEEAQAKRLWYSVDTYGGQSGSAVMHNGAVVGIHNYGGCPNCCTRVTTEVEEQLRAWLEESNK